MDGMTTSIQSINPLEGMGLAFQIGAQEMGGKTDLNSANLDSVELAPANVPNVSGTAAKTAYSSGEIDLLA